MGLIKNLWRGFKGGPDFSNCTEITALLEDWRLNLTLPVTIIITEEEPRNINYPFNQSGWFEANAKQSRQHYYIHIDTQLWYYLPAYSVVFQGELGLLSLSTQLKRILPEKNTDANDLNALGHYVIAEYDDYYNAALDSDGHGGENIEWLKRFDDEVRNAWEGYISEEEIQAKIAERTPPVPYPPLPPHQIRTINNRDWVFCDEQGYYFHDKIYCHPLSEQYYLCLNFRHRVDNSGKYKNWKAHAEAAEKRIMEMVRLEKIKTP